MIILDSNIFIYLANGSLSAAALSKEPLAYPSVVKVETLGYPMITAQELSFLEKLFMSCEQLELDELVVSQAITLRQQRRISLGDAIIAATALVYDCELWTANTEDFKHIDRLRLHDPLQSRSAA